MCEFCEGAKIIYEHYTAYSVSFVERMAVLENRREMRIKFEDNEALHSLNYLHFVSDVTSLKISFCPICGRKLTGTEDSPMNEKENNAISHPSHYCDGRKYEPRKVIADWKLNFNLGNAIKYLSRAGRKGDKVEDLRKAIQYIEFEIEEIENESNN